MLHRRDASTRPHHPQRRNIRTTAMARSPLDNCRSERRSALQHGICAQTALTGGSDAHNFNLWILCHFDSALGFCAETIQFCGLDGFHTDCGMAEHGRGYAGRSHRTHLCSHWP